MHDLVCGALGALLLLVTALAPAPGPAPHSPGGRDAVQECPPIHGRPATAPTTRVEPFARTELYFGAAMPHGAVTGTEFRSFIDRHVTPHFPDGLTVLNADGRSRRADGGLVKERSFVVVLLYPRSAAAHASERIERVRALYKERFEQLSVLRVDDARGVCASY